MKRQKFFYLFVICTFIAVNSMAQTNGRAIYTTILESEDFKKLRGELIFSENKSLFFFNADTIADDDDYQSVNMQGPSTLDFEFSFGESLVSYHEVFIDKRKKEILSSERYYKDGKEHSCLTIEPTNIFVWNITDETKEIGSFQSTKATTTFRGRNYTAWFTTEVSVSSGPWKFHGLPGLILEIYDDEMGVQFLLSSIDIPFESTRKIEPPNSGERISIEEYAKYQSKLADEIVELIKAKLPRGANVSKISATQTNKGIEREF